MKRYRSEDALQVFGLVWQHGGDVIPPHGEYPSPAETLLNSVKTAQKTLEGMGVSFSEADALISDVVTAASDSAFDKGMRAGAALVIQLLGWRKEDGT